MKEIPQQTHNDEQGDPNSKTQDELGSNVSVNVDLAPGSKVTITLESQLTDGKPTISQSTTYSPIGEWTETDSTMSEKPARVNAFNAINGIYKKIIESEKIQTAQQLIKANLDLEMALFIAAITIYFITRTIGLEDYPIFFFTDEAVNTVLASDFVRDGMMNYDKVFFPTFFVNNTVYLLNTSVYIQIIPYLLFGKSVFVTRLTAMLITLLAAYWVGKIFRDIFKTPYWWSGPLLLSITPAWFLHSRTAFEYCLLVTFYAGFLYYYLLYRTGKTRYLYHSLVLGALSYYSYSPGQVIMVVSGLLILLFDWRYHWENRKIGVKGFGVLVLAALPLVRFLISHPDEFKSRLIKYQSYWLEAIPFKVKAQQYLTNYLRGINPQYWFFYQKDELVRHVMGKYGHILMIMLPFFIIGLFLLIWRYWKSGEARSIIATILAAPSASALINIGINRVLVMIIPITILSGLGLFSSFKWLTDKKKISQRVLAVTSFVILALINILILRDALDNGRVWSDNYGLSGMQYGARQVFGEVRQHLDQSPGIKIDLSPTWTNGTTVVARFFLSDPLPIKMNSIDHYLNEIQDIDEDQLFILVADEYNKVIKSTKFTDVKVEKIIKYPNGSPGFYFTRFKYADNIAELMVADSEQRHRLQEGILLIGGETANVKYSFNDMGSIDDLFDGNPSTLLRTAEANPLIVQIDFDHPRSISGLALSIGGGPTDVIVELKISNIEEKLTFQQSYESVPNLRTVEIDIDGSHNVESLLVKVYNSDDTEPSHVHLWEINLKN